MPVQSMQAIAEHSLFKAALPLVCAALIGSITWIFVTVMDIDKVLHRVEEAEIPQINADIAKGYEKINDIVKSWSFKIKLIELKNKTWFSPVIPYNVGINHISPDTNIIILQNVVKCLL